MSSVLKLATKLSASALSRARVVPTAPAVRTHAPASSPAPRTTASQHAHKPAPAAQPQTEFIGHDGRAGGVPAGRPDRAEPRRRGTEFGLESP
jgi:hypothetical protein